MTQVKNDARKRRQIIALLSASKGKCMASFAKDIDECVAYLIEKQKEQKLAEPGVTNNESDYDRGYREGHKFGLERTEWYRLLGGKTFMGLIPCWVDAPSTLQPAHKHHGKNLIVMHENNGGFRCCCVDDEKPITFHLPEDTHLVEGWNKKPSEWSEEDDMLMDELESYILYDKEFNDEQKSWRIKRLKSLRPPSKQEWRRFLWHPMMKFDYTSIVKYDGSDEYEIVKAGNKPTREMKGAFIPIKEISTHPHWKPSQEQMKALEHFVDFHSQQYKNTGTRWSDYEALLSLQTDLLKLKLS